MLHFPACDNKDYVDVADYDCEDNIKKCVRSDEDDELVLALIQPLSPYWHFLSPPAKVGQGRDYEEEEEEEQEKEEQEEEDKKVKIFSVLAKTKVRVRRSN